jgi:hypothetical protein
MSSATSIDQQVRQVRMKPGSTGEHPPAAKSTIKDAGFRPWHFFILLSLVAATVAVVVSRRATPEHLIMISLTIAAAGVAGAACYRMLAPLVARDATVFSEPLTERTRAALEREKTLVLRSIKELEFDRAMGKLSPKDFDEMSGRLRARAVSLMQQLDEGTGYREAIERELQERLKRDVSPRTDPTVRLEPERAKVGLKPDAPGVRVESDASEVRIKLDSTCACGTVNDHDALFCKRCGARLADVSAAVDAERSE